MTTIEQARAMIERLELEESAFYIAGDSDAASTVRGAMRCIQSLITAVEQAEREALERAARVCDAENAMWVRGGFQNHAMATATCAHEIRALITGKDKL